MGQMGPHALRDIVRRHRGFARKVASFPLLADRSGRQRRRPSAIADLPEQRRRFVPPLLGSPNAMDVAVDDMEAPSVTELEAIGVSEPQPLAPTNTIQHEPTASASQPEDVVGDERAATLAPGEPNVRVPAHGASGQRRPLDLGGATAAPIPQKAVATSEPVSRNAGEPAHREPVAERRARESVDAGAAATAAASAQGQSAAMEPTGPANLIRPARPEEVVEAGMRPPARPGRGRRRASPETPAATTRTRLATEALAAPAEPEAPVAPELNPAEPAAEPSGADVRGSLAEAASDRGVPAKLPQIADESLPAPDWVEVGTPPKEPARRSEFATEIDPANLFAPVANDRSPATWHARLVEAARRDAAKAGSAPISPRAPETQKRHAIQSSQVASIKEPSSAEPPAGSTRRFLTPLVGLDPGTTRLHRDTAADTVLSVHHADALSAGDDIFLAARFAADSPESAGLLAHELVHVARGREPGFVPPVARETHARESAQDTMSNSGPATPDAPQPDARTPKPATDEESLATLTEARVTALARAQTEAPLSLRPHEIRMPRSARPALPALAAGGAQRQRTEATDPWGGLPAPWEPLPGWLLSLPDGAIGMAAESGAVATLSAPAATSADASSGVTAPVVHRAAVDRTVPDASTTTVGDVPAPSRPGEPAPDLDALAQQVHALLKRRLAAERRREG